MASNDNILNLVKRREIDDKIARKIQSRLQVTEDLILRLGLEKELEGHSGCVNCLEWNSSGEILASASDDYRIILWDPFHYRSLQTITTNHQGNIFSVKFMPKTNDSIMISGAADCMINIHDVKQHETIRVCSCHTNRVKRLAVCPESPSMFWSSSEDGTVRQFDLRAPHVCKSETANVLISLRHHIGRLAEAKCLAINPVRSEILAVGANDPFVRLYDRRMIRPIAVQLHTPDGGLGQSHPHVPRNIDYTLKANYLPEGCAEYFVAGHLRSRYSPQGNSNLNSTYVTFGANGRDLLVNLGGEQIYLFDIYNKTCNQFYDFKSSPYYFDGQGTSSTHECSSSEGPGPSNGRVKGVSKTSPWILALVEDANANPIASRPSLPPRVESLRLRANYAFDSLDYPTAVRLYNEAINLCSGNAVLYGNRAAALMKRAWDGDIYAALRDCQKTLELEPNHYKAHFRMVRCLLELQWTAAAADCLNVFKNKYPSHAQNTACRALEKDIELVLALKEKEKATGEDVKEDMKRNEAISWDLNVQPYSFKPICSAQEEMWQNEAYDFEKRFCGHCNTTTDIKEANFFGENGQFIIAGSDEGSIYFWDRSTTNNIRILKGDSSIVNCLQPHPSLCLLASSGIDPVVRLWSPLPQDGRKDDREVSNKDVAAKENQIRMKANQVGVVLMNYMRFNPDQANPDPSGEDEDEEDFLRRVPPDCSCRPS